MGEEIFLKLRYCFQAGYTLPQYCIDKGIKRPLFVMEKAHEWFLREICVQFRFDKRLLPEFCFIDGEKDGTKLSFYLRVIGMAIRIKDSSNVQFDDFDSIILLTTKKFDLIQSKIIRFTELEEFFIKRTYVDIPLLNFLQRNPKVKLFLTNFPNNLNRYKGGEEFDSQLRDAGELQWSLTKKQWSQDKNKHMETSFDKFGYTNAEVIELLNVGEAKINADGTTSLIDNNNPLKRIKNGKRETAYQPDTYRNKIYFFGPCYHLGRNAPFDKTIESYLQKMLNEHNLPYRVENEGQGFSERSQDMFYNLNTLNFKPGDIIFFYFWGLHSNYNIIPFCDINDVFDPPHDYREIFCTKGHVNELGYKLVAEKYFKFLTENNFFREVELNYPLPPPIIITDTAYRLGSSRAA